jgi:hypothetical protein
MYQTKIIGFRAFRKCQFIAEINALGKVMIMVINRILSAVGILERVPPYSKLEQHLHKENKVRHCSIFL